MRSHILTNFPDSFTSFFDTSILRIARQKWLFTPQTYNLGDYSSQAQHRVDDRPYGGGAGAIIQIEPLYKGVLAIEDTIKNTINDVKKTQKVRKFFLWPRGKRLEQSDFDRLSLELCNQDFIVVCGHYEGVDHRLFDIFGFEEYSIWDYVVSGGEVATMVFLDALVRLIPGVIGNEDSLHEESFSPALDGKKEYPQYSRPEDFMGYRVPQILLSWDHTKIEQWRREQCL